MMACLLGLLRTERLAREMSAVTRVMDILQGGARSMLGTRRKDKHVLRHGNMKKTREANSGRESEGWNRSRSEETDRSSSFWVVFFF